MKKIIFGLLLLTSGVSFSQFNLQLEDTRFGVIVGPTYSAVTNVHVSSEPRYSFYAGAFALIPFDYDDQFYFQPQLEFFGAGEKDSGSGQYFNNYVSVPIYFKGYFSNSETEFFGFGGPRFSFLIKEKIKNASRNIYEKDKMGDVSTFDFSLSGGLGFSYKRKVEAALRYDLGLNNVYPDYKEVQYPNSLKKKSQQSLSLGISYIF